MNQQQQQQRAAEREARYEKYKRMTLTELMEHARTTQYRRQLETAQTALQLELPVYSNNTHKEENC